MVMSKIMYKKINYVPDCLYNKQIMEIWTHYKMNILIFAHILNFLNNYILLKHPSIFNLSAAIPPILLNRIE